MEIEGKSPSGISLPKAKKGMCQSSLFREALPTLQEPSWRSVGEPGRGRVQIRGVRSSYGCTQSRQASVHIRFLVQHMSNTV